MAAMTPQRINADSLSKPGRRSAITCHGARRGLFDLGFLEFDVLTRDRIVLAQGQFFGLRLRILACGVIEARAGRADERRKWLFLNC